MISAILTFIALFVLIFDTAGHIVFYSLKEATDKIKDDYNRLIYTWIFYLSICKVCCMSGLSDGEGYFASFFSLTFALLKLYIAIPITGGVNTFKVQFIDNSLISKLVKKLSNSVNCQANKTEEKVIEKKEEVKSEENKKE